MDTNEKVKRFHSRSELTQEIIKDKESRDMLAQRYCVRFIMLNNFDEFKALAKFMTDIGISSLDLENIHADEDEWITKTDLKDAITACTESTFVTPFSEIARFYSDEDFRGFFNEIMLLEDIHNPKKRIYIPLIGLQNRFTDFLNHFARIQESAPVWRYDSEQQSVKVYFTRYKNFILPSGEIQCQLDSLKDWLRFWKKQAPQERIVCTSQPIAAKHKYSRPDNIFEFTKISNAYEFMRDFLELQFPFPYIEEENEHWEKLVETIDKQKIFEYSFDNHVKSRFNVLKIGSAEVLQLWSRPDVDDFDRWMLQKYVIYTNFGDKNPYLKRCMGSVGVNREASDLAIYVATQILYDSVKGKCSDEIIYERRSIITSNRDYFRRVIPQDILTFMLDCTKSYVQKQNDLSYAVQLCTGVFDFEKTLLMGWFANHKEVKEIKQAVEVLYPELCAYAQEAIPSVAFTGNHNWSLKYLQDYKKAKLLDRYTEEIASTIKTKNENATSFYKWYFSFKNSHEALAELEISQFNKPDKVYWIDGLGAEFLPYILYLVEQEHSNLKVIQSQITRANLPSSTVHNRFESVEKKFEALDALGHDSHRYKHFDTLAKELDVLKGIIHEIIMSCQQELCTVAIVSDHGLSCLSRLTPSKKYDGKIEHEGRYSKTDATALSDTDYIVHENETTHEKYKVALTHCSLSKVPTHQVHGGCTPEELLVPFIVLSNKNINTRIKFQIDPLETEVKISSPVVRVIVKPNVKSVKLTFKGKDYDMTQEGAQWNALLEDVSEGKHEILIYPQGGHVEKFEINITGIGGQSVSDLMDL